MRLSINLFMTFDGVSQGPGAPDEDWRNGFNNGRKYVVASQPLVDTWADTTTVLGSGVHVVEMTPRDTIATA